MLDDQDIPDRRHVSLHALRGMLLQAEIVVLSALGPEQSKVQYVRVNLNCQGPCQLDGCCVCRGTVQTIPNQWWLRLQVHFLHS